MGTIRLEISEAGIRPIGFFSRDRADEAIAELQALLMRLSPDRRPVAVRWRRDGERLVPRKEPFFEVDRPSFVGWDADRGTLAGEAAGTPFEACAEADTFRIQWGGRPLLASGRGWTDPAGDSLGPDGPLRLTVEEQARVGTSGLVVGIWLDGDGALPADAIVHAIWSGGGRTIDLGAGRRADGAFAWTVPARAEWPAAPWSLRIATDLGLDGPSDAAVELVEATAFTAIEVIGLAAVTPGDALTAVRFAHADDAAAPAQVALTLLAAAARAETAAICVSRSSRSSDYRLDPPFVVPVDLAVPARIFVSAEGQDEAVGALIAGPRVVRASWRLTRDERGNARLPRISADCLRPIGVRGRFSPTPDGQVRVEADDLAVTAPLADDGFAPLCASDPSRPVWETTFAGAAGAAIAWIPGYPPMEVAFDAEGRVRARGPALEELAREATRRGMPLRIDAGEARAVAFPAAAAIAGEEVSPSGGRLSLHGPGDLRYTLWFRGLVLPCAVETLGAGSDQRILRLETPLPCDGRLGLDVGPFLPVRVLDLPDGARIIDGDRHLRVVGVDRVRPATADSSFLTESKYGFHAEQPREPLGRYAWNGLILGRDRSGWSFYGWLLDPGFEAPAAGPWPGYGFRAGPSAGSVVNYPPTGPRPAVAPAVAAAADAMLADGSRAPRALACADGEFVLTPIFDDPRRAAVWIEIAAVGGATIPAVRLFRRA